MTALGVMPVFVRKPQELAVTAKAIASWCATTDQELLVVDDCSPDEELRAKLVDFTLQYDQVNMVLAQTNSGFASTVNIGLQRALDEGIDACLVNSDIEFLHTNWFEHMDANDAWVIGALLLFPNRLVQHAGIYYSVVTRTFMHRYAYSPANLAVVAEKCVCPVTGALQLIRHEALKSVGVYDSSFRLGFEDVSFCHDVFVAGQQCVYEPTAIAIHHESLFRGKNPNKKIQEWQRQSWERLHEKHAGLDFSAWCPTMIEGNWE